MPGVCEKGGGGRATHVGKEAYLLVVLQELLELLADIDLDGLVSSCLGPEANLVLLCTHVHHHTADLITLCELLTDASQQLQMHTAGTGG